MECSIDSLKLSHQQMNHYHNKNMQSILIQSLKKKREIQYTKE